LARVGLSIEFHRKKCYNYIKKLFFKSMGQYTSAKVITEQLRKNFTVNGKKMTLSQMNKIMSKISGGSYKPIAYGVNKMSGKYLGHVKVGGKDDMAVETKHVEGFLKQLNEKIVRNPELQKELGLKVKYAAGGKTPKFYKAQDRAIKSIQKEALKKSGPSKDELAEQARIKKGQERLHQYEAYKSNYGNADPIAVARGETNKPAEQVNVSSSKKGTDNNVYFARGTSLQKSKGVDTGTGFVGTFGQDDADQEDTSKNISTGKVTDINKYRQEKEKDKNKKKEAENSGKFGEDIQDSFDIDNDNSNIKKAA
jgi:hypothetical protein